MSKIKVIPYNEAEGRLKEIYDDLISKRGKLAQVHTIQSLRPESIVKHMDLYLEIMFTKSALSRAEREMMAVVVSVENGCDYCRIHHAEALNHYWKDENKIKLLKDDFTHAGLSLSEIALCEFAMVLTVNPQNADKTNITEPLRMSGFNDHAILDATLVVAYFNFVNRLVLALGVHVEEDAGRGYKY